MRACRTGRPVAEHALGRVDAQLHELLGVQHGQLHHLAHLLDLRAAATGIPFIFFFMFY
jgi:hypothetical protein